MSGASFFSSFNIQPGGASRLATPQETNSMTTKVTVVDSIMGSGKTSWIIDRMNADAAASAFDDDHAENRYIYVTPLLSEVDRIKRACPAVEFREPQPIKGRKLNGLNGLIAEDRNICTTHKLFTYVDQETRELLKESNYTLVLDEETEWVREYPIKKSDWDTLNDADMVWTDELKRLRWNHRKYPGDIYDGRFKEILTLCDNGNLVVAWDEDRARAKVLIWEFPSEALGLFREVYILTYLFEGSILSQYLKASRIPYQTKSLKGRELVEWEDRDESDTKARMRELLTIIEDESLNRVGKPVGQENPLSASWFDKDIKAGGHKTRKLRLATMNYYQHHSGSRAKENMWTCYGEFRHKLKGDRYATKHTACNLKATNDYAERHGLAYLANVFMRPFLKNYLRDCGVAPDEDQYALSQLIQWVWRSRIRKDEPVTLYVPSQRMRELLKAWLWERPALRLVA